MKVLIILNPASGKNTIELMREAVTRQFTISKIDFEIYESKRDTSSVSVKSQPRASNKGWIKPCLVAASLKPLILCESNEFSFVIRLATFNLASSFVTANLLPCFSFGRQVKLRQF